MDAFWSAPPIARTLTALVLFESVAVYGRLLAGQRIIFAWPFIWTFPPEIWRFFTAFFLSGPQLAIIFDPYTIWQYSSALETESPRFAQPGDFLTYILFVGAVIALSANYLFGSVIFTGGLITAIAYTYAQENRGKKIHFMVVTLDVKWLPYANIFLNFIINGLDATKVMILGIPAAHLYDFLTRLWPAFGGGRNMIRTPAFISRIFGGPQRVTVAKQGTIFRPPPQTTTTSFQGGWGSRGQGRRLGGE
ncbi:hypothetical protein MMC13_001515 [Lambiella insularis]|nr:hypothetical protein [Lambiella insularis]